MKVLIDADGCPVVAETIAAARKRQVPVLLVCDTAHEMKREGTDTLIAPKGRDAADFALLARVARRDIVVTQDYGLAAMALAKGARVVDQNGRLYDDRNIDRLLEERHLAAKIRRAGGRLKGPTKRRAEQTERYLVQLNQLLLEIVDLP